MNPKDVGEILRDFYVAKRKEVTALHIKIDAKKQAKSQLKDLLLNKLPEEKYPIPETKENYLMAKECNCLTAGHNYCLSQVKKMIEEVCK